ncbi:MAG TPA: hypothetical protein VIL18_10375 [Longimicrobiales bacterium]
MTPGGGVVAMRDVLQRVPGARNSSFWYNLCLATIGASAALYLMGRKHAALFVGLWPATFAALGNRAELNEEIIELATGQPIQQLGTETQIVPQGFGFTAGGGTMAERPAA